MTWPIIGPHGKYSLAERTMSNQKHTIITMRRLQGALKDVRNELDVIGVLDERLESVDVYLTWFGVAYGYQYYKSTGHIEIPAVSIARLGERFSTQPRMTLRDLLRHEYGHAVADQNRGLIRSKQFRLAFGSGHDAEIQSDYCPSRHVSAYAATDACEDFAEVFMRYLKHGGKVPTRFRTPAILAKWSFVESLCQQIERGQRRWLGNAGHRFVSIG